jgi:hypothetical protein
MIDRRQFLGVIVTSVPARLLACAPGEAERLLAASEPSERVHYTATAVITIAGVAIFTRPRVGSGFISICQRERPEGTETSIEFGAGSFPEAAHGLNRLGIIRETVVERSPAAAERSAYSAFMTTSKEKNLSQARDALDSANSFVPYTAAQSYASAGRIATRVDHMELPRNLTWHDSELLWSRVRAFFETSSCSFETESGPADTFLYSAHRALIDPHSSDEMRLHFNGKTFALRTRAEADYSIGSQLSARGLIGDARRVMRLDAAIWPLSGERATPFRIWYDSAFPERPPIRFEYQARSFLRLVFERENGFAPSNASRRNG